MSCHVISCHVTALRLNCNVFGIEWDRYITITAIFDHLSDSKGRRLVYFSLKKLNCGPKGHMTAATTHHHVGMAVALSLEILLFYFHLPTYAICQCPHSAWNTHQTVDLCKSFIPALSSEVFFIKLVTNSVTFMYILGNRFIILCFGNKQKIILNIPYSVW